MTDIMFEVINNGIGKNIRFHNKYYFLRYKRIYFVSTIGIQRILKNSKNTVQVLFTLRLIRRRCHKILLDIYNNIPTRVVLDTLFLHLSVNILMACRKIVYMSVYRYTYICFMYCFFMPPHEYFNYFNFSTANKSGLSLYILIKYL